MKSKSTTTTAAKIIEVADSMRHAEALWQIPYSTLRLAKFAGCLAFEKSRVHRTPLLKWLKEHPEIVTQGEQGTSDAELKRQRLAIAVQHAQLNLDQAKELLIPLVVAEDKWSKCSAIVCEEAQGLMERDIYRIFIERIRARLIEVSGAEDQIAGFAPGTYAWNGQIWTLIPTKPAKK